MKTLLLLSLAAGAAAQNYTVSTFAGVALPVNLPGNSVSVGVNGGVVADAAGNVYFTDGARIMAVDGKTGLLRLVAGTGGAGSTGGGPATAAQLDRPNALAIDSAGTIYVAEAARIRKISGGVIITIAGTGTAGAAGDNGPASLAQVAPIGLAIDSSGAIYFTDTVASQLLGGGFFSQLTNSGSVRKISNGVITTVAGNGNCCGQPTADGVAATSVPLYEPGGIAIDSAGNIFVACSSDTNGPGLVRKISNGIITTVAGSGTTDGTAAAPATSVRLNNLGGLAIDAAGDLFLADASNNIVREISGGDAITVAGYGLSGYGGDGGPATGSRLTAPQSIALDAAGDLFVADTGNSAVRKVANGLIFTIAGNGALDFSGDNGPATVAQLNHPTGLAVSSAGDVYIADTQNSRVRRVSNSVISTFAGNGGTGFTGDGGPATAAALFYPQAQVFDSTGDMIIADSLNGRIREVSNGIITTVLGGGSGLTGYGDGGPATSAYLAEPVGSVAVDRAGNIYVLDSSRNRVREVSNGIIQTVAGNGNAGFGGDGGPAASALLNSPQAIAVDQAGNLYIADSGNNRIRQVANGIIRTVVGGGQPTADVQLNYPTGVAVDSFGNLYVGDLFFVRKVSGGTVSMIAGGGSDALSDNLPALSAQVSPSGIAADGAGNVYFSETGTNRVRVLRPAADSCPGLTSAMTRNIGNLGGALSVDVVANPSCAWTVPGLPSWITYSGSGGIGPATITLAVAQNNGPTRSATFTIAGTTLLVIQGGPLTISTSTALPSGAIGAAYTQTFAAAGGLSPYTWSLSAGTLPPGLTLSTAGTLAGTPAAAGLYQFVVLVMDAGSLVTSQAYSLTIVAPGGSTPPGSIVSHAMPTASRHVFVDGNGNVYSASQGANPQPVTPGAAQAQSNGAMQCGQNNSLLCMNAYFTKADSSGNLVAATFLGGPSYAVGNAITADAQGNLYVEGQTGGALPGAIGTPASGGSSFAAKLTADGTKFLYVTYLPGQLSTGPAALAVDAARAACTSAALPPTTGRS